MSIGASVVMRGNHPNPKRLISGGGWIHSGVIKSRGQTLRNFGQMTKVLSEENAKNFATFFDPDRQKLKSQQMVEKFKKY